MSSFRRLCECAYNKRCHSGAAAFLPSPARTLLHAALQRNACCRHKNLVQPPLNACVCTFLRDRIANTTPRRLLAAAAPHQCVLFLALTSQKCDAIAIILFVFALFLFFFFWNSFLSIWIYCLFAVCEVFSFFISLFLFILFILFSHFFAPSTAACLRPSVRFVACVAARGNLIYCYSNQSS